MRGKEVYLQVKSWRIRKIYAQERGGGRKRERVEREGREEKGEGGGGEIYLEIGGLRPMEDDLPSGLSSRSRRRHLLWLRRDQMQRKRQERVASQTCLGRVLEEGEEGVDGLL